MQCPWAGAFPEGHKTIKTRAFGILSALLGKRIAIIQSSKGKAEVSSMGLRIAAFSYLSVCSVKRMMVLALIRQDA
jgi:hypothetical protein